MGKMERFLGLGFLFCFLLVSLFGPSGGVQSVVEGSVIQLYCSVEAATAVLSWTKDNVSVIIDVPHLRVRMTSNDTHNTSVLTLDNFRSGDNGMYQCHVMSGGVTEIDNSASLTAFTPTVSGALVFRQQPADIKATVNNHHVSSSFIPHGMLNRTAISLGDTVDPTLTPDAYKLLRCVVGHENDDTMNFTASTVVWVKDGGIVEDGGNITISTSVAVNGEVSSTLQIVNFQESNAGVYQCIFTDDNNSDGETITSIPLRLDTGETLTIKRISPETIILRPPEKLVIEVKTTGRYKSILWYRNGNLFGSSETVDVFAASSEFVNYFEIFACEPTTESDFGVYKVQLDPFDQTQILVPDRGDVDFAVIRAVNASTTAISGPTVTVLEGDSVDISCNSTGVPTPSITWSFNDTATHFEQTDDAVDFEANIGIANQVIVDPGVTTSVLQIVNASYPDHDGEYTCVGVNSEDAIFTSSSAIITVKVQVAPSFVVEPNDVIVRETESDTFVCQVSGVPRPSVTWGFTPNEGAPTPVPLSQMPGEVEISEMEIGDRERSSNLTIVGVLPSNAGNYTCTAENLVANGSVITSTAVLMVYVSPMVTSVYPDEGQISYTVNETDPVTFECSATGIPPPTITWLRNGMELNDSRVTVGDPMEMDFTRANDNETVSMVTHTLNLINTTDGDSGMYICMATNDAVPGNSTMDLQATVHVPPTIIALDGDQMIIANESESVVLSFTIERAAPPVPTEDTRWFYSAHSNSDDPLVDSVDITNLTNRTSVSMLSFSTDLLTLTINNTVQAQVLGEETDQGRYFLVAYHPAGARFEYTDLYINSSPLVSTEPVDQTVINNGSRVVAVFACFARATPQHSVSWIYTSYDGEQVNIISTLSDADTSKYRIVRDTKSNRFGELTVLVVQFSDRGTYNCTAENTFGSETRGAILAVHVTPVIERTYTPGDVIFPLSATLVCLVTGYPIPSVSWQKDGANVSQARLDYRPEMNESARYFDLLNVSIEEVLSLGELGLVSVLTFDEVVREDTANYTCTAVNELPETTRIVNISESLPLVVLERPDAPVNVVAFVFGARWIALRWTSTFSGNRPVNAFNIYIQNVNETDNFNFLIDLDPVSLMENGDSSFMYNISAQSVVFPFVEYSFRVNACNVIGCSEQNDSSEVIMTDQDRPDAPPVITEAFSPSSTSIYLSWNPPPVELHRGILTGYRITYNIENSIDLAAFQTTTDTSITFEDLRAFTLYHVTVSAGTVVGFGPEDSTNIMTRDDRSAPTPTLLRVTSVTSVTAIVSWQIDTSTIPITGYMVHVVTSTTSQVVFSDENLPPTALMLTLRDLQPTTDYQFFISAVNTAGTGEQASVTFTTITDAAFFQLRLQLTGIGQSCNEWVAVDRVSLRNEVANSIVTNVEGRCQCGFTRSNITSDGFRCFPGSTDAVTYRGEIHETETVSVFDLIRHIEEWTSEGVSILVQQVFLEVDSSCSVAIESFNEEECLPPSGTQAASIIGGAVAAVVVVLIIIAGIVIITIVILVMKKRKALFKLENSFRFGTAYGDVNVTAHAIQRIKEEGLDGETEYEVMEMVSHDYETLEYEIMDTSNTRRQLTGGYDINGYEVTQCLAYVTTSSTTEKGRSSQASPSTEGSESLEEREEEQADFEPAEEEESGN